MHRYINNDFMINFIFIFDVILIFVKVNFCIYSFKSQYVWLSTTLVGQRYFFYLTASWIQEESRNGTYLTNSVQWQLPDKQCSMTATWQTVFNDSYLTNSIQLKIRYKEALYWIIWVLMLMTANKIYFSRDIIRRILVSQPFSHLYLNHFSLAGQSPDIDTQITFITW